MAPERHDEKWSGVGLLQSVGVVGGVLSWRCAAREWCSAAVGWNDIWNWKQNWMFGTGITRTLFLAITASKTSLWSILMDRDGTESYIDPDGAGLVGCGGVVFVKKHGVGWLCWC